MIRSDMEKACSIFSYRIQFSPNFLEAYEIGEQ